MPETVRQGVVEVETLRRYGRVPIGTRAQFPFFLVKHDARQYWVQYTVQIGEDPRQIGTSCGINMFTDSEEIIQMSRYVRGVLKPFEGNLAAYALLCVVDSL